MNYAGCMTAVTFDTLKFARTLEDAGVPKEQANVHARALVEALETGLAETVRHADLSDLVTHADLKAELANFATKKDLEFSIRDLESRMTIKMGTMIFALGGFLLAVKFLG
jgi:hypothetical protein